MAQLRPANPAKLRALGTNMTINISYVPPSLNVLLRRHWSWRKRQAEKIAILVVAAVGRPLVPETRKMRLQFTVYRKRLLDEDNLRGSTKICLDVLVRLGWVRDDSPEWLDHLPPRQVKVKDGEHTVIELSPAGFVNLARSTPKGIREWRKS